MIIVFTGDGKGKSTASFGLAVRFLGHNMKVAIIQFMKKYKNCGEHKFFRKIKKIKIFTGGAGFTWVEKNIEKHKLHAKKTWTVAKNYINSKKYNLVILDEITFPINYNLIDKKEIIDFFKKIPKNIDIAITGRDAPKEIIEVADLVTEMNEIRHPFKIGVKAKKGIEF